MRDSYSRHACAIPDSLPRKMAKLGVAGEKKRETEVEKEGEREAGSVNAD